MRYRRATLTLPVLPGYQYQGVVEKETYDLQESDCSDSKIIHIKTLTGPCEIKHNYTTNLDHNLSDTNESDSLLFRIRILMLFSPLKTARKQAVTVIQ